MIHKRIDFTEDGRVYMNTYFLDYYPDKYYKNGKWQPDQRPVFLVLPGGGYGFQSDREAEPIALAFTAAGIHAAVLYYSVGGDAVLENLLTDTSKAIWYLRSHAAEYHINPDAIIVGGFSAGGSLASVIGTQWNRPGLAEGLDIPCRGNRPDGLMLAYAPSLMSPETVQDDPGDEPRGKIFEEMDESLNTASRVTKDTPPAFIWQTSHDTLIKPINSLLYTKACLDHGVECELHIFQDGPHGTALANDVTDYKGEKYTNVELWVPMFINWIRKMSSF